MRRVMLVLALSFAAAAPVSAASVEKTEWKETKKDKKTIDKYVKKYEKGIAKDKASKYDADIKAWAQGELADLRGMGIKTRKKAKPQHPAEAPAPEPPSENPWFDELAQVLKDVRADGKPKMRLKAMKKASKMYGTWEQRRERKL